MTLDGSVYTSDETPIPRDELIRAAGKAGWTVLTVRDSINTIRRMWVHVEFEEWKKLVAAPVSVLLKSRGFQKRGLNFIAARSKVTLLVGLQSSADTTGEVLKITCNLGIRLECLITRPGADIWEAHWRERIGAFLPEASDHWWSCSNDEDAQKAGTEIAGLLDQRGIPEMESLASPAALAALWSSGQSPGLTQAQRVDYLSRLEIAG